MLVTLTNFVVFQYALGAVRAALDEGVRAGARAFVGDPLQGELACAERAAEVMDGLLPGPMGRRVAIECSEVDGQMTAYSTGSFPGWIRGAVPDASAELKAAAVKERRP